MSDSSPAGPVFPPFGPAFSRPAAASRPAAPPPLPEATPDVPQEAAFGGGETREAEPMSAAAEEGLPWELPAAPELSGGATAEVAGDAGDAGGAGESESNGDEDAASEDLPWLELPAGTPHSHAEPAAADPWAAPDTAAADAAPWEQPAPEVTSASAWEQDAPAAPETAAWEPEADQPAAAAWETPAAADAPSAPDTSWMDWQDPQPAASEDTGMPAADEPQPTAATQADDTYFGSVHVEPAPGLVPVGDISGSEPEGTAQPFVAPPPPAEAVFTEKPAPHEPAFDDSTARAETLAVAEMPASSAAAAPSPIAGHFGEVAARLERIARELRSDPQAFLAGGTADPLDLLVTGFVLGASQRR